MTATPTRLLGDICPPWCCGEHTECRMRDDGQPVDPEDAGVYHGSRVVDTWYPMDGDGKAPVSEAAIVRIEGYRHDNGDDWPDRIEAENVSRGRCTFP